MPRPSSSAARFADPSNVSMADASTDASTVEPPPGLRAASAETGPAQHAAFHARPLARDAAGGAVLVGCFLCGTWLARELGLPVPGNVLGMALLLALLGLGAVPHSLVAGAARRLLFLLPVLFVPVYVPLMLDAAFWARWGAELLPAALLGTVMTLIAACALAGRMVRR